jgi:outer membrane cobalamin receptor
MRRLSSRPNAGETLRITLTGAARRAAILTAASAALLDASTVAATGAAAIARVATYSVRTNARRDTLYVVPAIVIEASRNDPAFGLYERPGFVAAVELDGRRERMEDLADVLSGMVGVNVEQYGGLGDFATVSVRGSSAAQVTVFLDGIPMNDPYTGVTNLADLPLGAVERVEVYRGFAPPQLGASAIGGAVNLVTEYSGAEGDGSALSHLNFNSSYGSFDTIRQQLSVRASPWLIRLFAHGSYARTSGDFTFLDNDGTPLNPSDDAEVMRTNNDAESYEVLGRIEFDLPRDGTVSIGHDRFWREQGVPGLGNNQSISARAERDRRLTYLKLASGSLLGRQLRMTASGHTSTSGEQFRDLEGTVGLGPQDTDNTIESYGGRASGKWFVPRVPVSLEAVFEGRKEEFHPVEKFPVERKGPDRWRRSQTTALVGEVYLSPGGQTLVLSGTQRWERQVSEFYDDAPFPWIPPSPRGRVAVESRTPSGGFRWTPVASLTVKGNIGRYYRLPTFLELFGNVGSVTGNSELEPETGLNRDVGIIFNSGRMGPIRRLFAEATYLYNDVGDLILFFPNSQHTSRPVNIGSALITGWEFSLSAVLPRAFEISSNYTRLQTEDTSEIPYYRGNELPSRPRDDVSAAAAFPWRAWKLTYEYHYLGANFLDRANMQAVPARNLHNVALRWDLPWEGLSLTAEGRNLTDDRASDVSGFPLPGRSFYTTVGFAVNP